MGTTKKRYIELYGEKAWEAEKEKRKGYFRQYYADNCERIKERQNKYLSEHKEENKERCKDYYYSHREERIEFQKDYSKKHQEEISSYQKEYHSTMQGRANMLLSNYRYSDKMYDRGDCTLTGDWIVNNIFNSTCTYCGETDWTKLGCDRIDNAKAHTPDNVVCACEACNKQRQDRYSVEDFIKHKG